VGEGELAGDLTVGGRLGWSVVVVPVGWAELGVVVAVGIDIGQGGVVDPRGQLLLVGDLEQA
jgi:hypothetical protein